jgi:GTP cyclohydrolase FolE2
MSIKQAVVAYVAALLASISVSYAGPCSHEITQVRGEIDARLKAIARAAPSASQSTTATTHRQRTQKSIAEAEVKLGVASPEKVKAIDEAMVRAIEADRKGDRSGCERALADARRVLRQ